MFRSLAVLLGLLFMGLFAFGQITPLYPDVPVTYEMNKAIINPAYIPEVGNYVFAGIYKFEVGEPNIAVFDANGAVVFNNKNNKQLVRLAFSNEKEGPYIKTPRGNLNYAYQLSISEELKISTGISLGYVSRVYSAPSSTGQGNVTLPDGNLGVTLRYKKMCFGAAVMQFLNSEGSALQSKLKLNSYYHFHASFQQDIDQYWSLKEYMLLRILPEVAQQIIGGVNLVYSEVVEIGAMYYQRRGIAFQLLLAINQTTNPLKISVGYNSSLLAESPLWINSVELGLNYTLR